MCVRACVRARFVQKAIIPGRKENHCGTYFAVATQCKVLRKKIN